MNGTIVCPQCSREIAVVAMSCRCGWHAEPVREIWSDPIRRNGNPVVRGIREAYLASPMYARKSAVTGEFLHVSTLIYREPGSDDE